MVTTRYPVWFCALLFFHAISAVAVPASDGTPHYYDSFDPQLTPWVAPQERNFEEVFKHYRYFAVRYTDDGARLSVTQYRQGKLVDTTYWQRQPDGALLALASAVSAKQARGPVLYQELCASCHGADRLGGAGPALLPSNLGRLQQAAAADVIRDGRPATQMPPFGKQLDDATVQQLTDYIYTKPDSEPVWDSGERVADLPLQGVKRIPMRKPPGKYNVFNKINRSAGTSH